jgi:hypothetical protein
MHGRALLVALSMVAALMGPIHAAQQLVRTPLPTVTAENEPWYLNGEPITYSGNLYVPAGAQIYFNSNEMVRSGFYLGVPLYTRTTVEPYSVVLVPLAGGRMQPYERPRTGELAGTAGSTPSTLPAPAQTVPPAGLAAQAAGAPSQTTQVLEMQLPRPEIVAAQSSAPTAPPTAERSVAAVGTSGRTAYTPMHTQIGGTPEGTDSIFIELDGERWYPLGAPVAVDHSRVTRLRDFNGFAVWGNGPQPTIIFIPSTAGSTLAVPYTRVPRHVRN